MEKKIRHFIKQMKTIFCNIKWAIIYCILFLIGMPILWIIINVLDWAFKDVEYHEDIDEQLKSAEEYEKQIKSQNNEI